MRELSLASNENEEISVFQAEELMDDGTNINILITINKATVKH